MTAHHLLRVLNAVPVNRQAAIVTRQAGCVEEDTDLTKPELVWLVDRLRRKHRLLKHVLGIKTKAQHTNLMYKYNKRIPQYRQRDEPRAMAEYIRCGKEMKRLIDELARLKDVRRFVAQAYPNPNWSRP